MLYMREEIAAPVGLHLDLSGRSAALLSAVGVLVLGLFPGPFLDWVESIVSGF